MWKKEDSKIQAVPEISTAPAVISAPVAPPVSSRENPSSPSVSPRATACISQGIRIKGDVKGSEDLFIDGHIEGKLDMGDVSLTVGPNGSVKADISAREVIVRGRVEGKIYGREKVQLWNTAHVLGEVQTQRLSIEEGGTLRGIVEAGKAPAKAPEARAASAGISSLSTESAKLNSGTAAD
jgi:cytoskeletal protein CcmA (bactofilin family)